ncbi:MAG: helix-turn-helix domain containing protein [Patulibacter minatonensis]
MARWQPDAPGRLATAALELFEERGFDATTAAQIAERAGVTERTFFRHYADKREVFFDGGAALEAAATASIEQADAAATPFAVAGDAARAAAAVLPLERLPFARRRQAIIDATPRLQERELLKMASLAAAVARGLEARGADPATAAIAAEGAIAAFRVAFLRWIAPENAGPITYEQCVADALAALRAVAAAT